jgi:hypothetical protein
MDHRFAATALMRLAFVIGMAFATVSAQAAVLDDRDTTRLTQLTEAIQSFENDIGSALHNLPSTNFEQLEAYAYVELNLEAAHERLNNVFMMVAVSIYVESATDQALILDVMYRQLLPRSKSYLIAKKDAIASMSVAHPDNTVFATYRNRADAILGERAIPLLDDLYQRIGAVQR